MTTKEDAYKLLTDAGFKLAHDLPEGRMYIHRDGGIRASVYTYLDIDFVDIFTKPEHLHKARASSQTFQAHRLP